MRLINTKSMKLHEFLGEEVPRYAILSHRWGDEEITLKDFQKGRDRESAGYRKVSKFCEIALADYDLEWAWVDTCCIDKRSSAELSEAINSMFRYYEDAKICIAHLADVSWHGLHTLGQCGSTKSAFAAVTGACGLCVETLENFQHSTWFKRGWTLQELLAPGNVEFFSGQWSYMGDRDSPPWAKKVSGMGLSFAVAAAASIPLEVLRRSSNTSSSLVLDHYSMAERLSWAASRSTTRPEDIAYSLLGLTGVNMPLLYGEGGDRAWFRLQESIIRASSDESIFAYHHAKILSELPLLAPSIKSFTKSQWSVATYRNSNRPASYSVGNQGVEMRLKTGTAFLHGTGGFLTVPLNCKDASPWENSEATDEELRTSIPCCLVLQQQLCGHFTRVCLYRTFDLAKIEREHKLDRGKPCDDLTVCIHATMKSIQACKEAMDDQVLEPQPPRNKKNDKTSSGGSVVTFLRGVSTPLKAKKTS